MFFCNVFNWDYICTTLTATTKNIYNDESFYYINSNQTGKISPIDNVEIKIAGTKPSIIYKISPVGIKIIVPHAGQ